MDRRQSALSAHILEAPRLTISNRPCWVAKGATQGAQFALQQPDSEGHLSPSASRALNSPSTNRISETGGVGSPLCAIAGPDWITQTSMQTISGARYLSIPLPTAVRRARQSMSQDADQKHLLYTLPMGIDANQIQTKWIRHGFPAFVPVNAGSRARAACDTLTGQPLACDRSSNRPRHRFVQHQTHDAQAVFQEMASRARAGNRARRRSWQIGPRRARYGVGMRRQHTRLYRSC